MTLEPLVPDWVKAAWSVASTTTPSLLERKGVHPMRESAAKWCRRNPEAAAWLPLWDPEVLKQAIRDADVDPRG